MSIVTKKGDHGQTALMYNRTVSKCDSRVEAYGAVDELNAAVGLARASTQHEFVKESLVVVQKDLIVLMGELATAVEDLPRYAKDGYPSLTAPSTSRLEEVVKIIESEGSNFRGWATPGANLGSAALDVARTVCRRAERRVCELQASSLLANPEIIVYLNRLSDLLWLMARWIERQ
jgi:cob(I)alamin adenosyltransferase